MRTALILLILLFSGPAAFAQEAPNENSSRQPPPLVRDGLPLPPRLAIPAPDPSERLAEDHALRQVRPAASPTADRAGDFLYSVLLTAVSTLVAALIWRALD